MTTRKYPHQGGHLQKRAAMFSVAWNATMPSVSDDCISLVSRVVSLMYLHQGSSISIPEISSSPMQPPMGTSTIHHQSSNLTAVILTSDIVVYTPPLKDNLRDKGGNNSELHRDSLLWVNVWCGKREDGGSADECEIPAVFAVPRSDKLLSNLFWLLQVRSRESSLTEKKAHAARACPR